MNDLRTLENPFQFTDSNIRTAVDDRQEVWFCAKDVCEALGISWSTMTLGNMPKDWFMGINFITIKGERETVFINEPGLYRLIFRSNKPKAEEFARWVCEEVLPQIRKHGFFGELSSKDYIAIVKQISDLTDRLVNSKNAFLHKVLEKPLRNLCTMAGHPMPDINLLSKDIEQLDLFGGQGNA